MSQREFEIYPVDRALDAIADLPGIRPLQVHRVAVPLYVAHLSATVTARDSFDLLDKYVGLAIADAEFRSLAEISDYLGITPDIVHRVLRFLGEIGHVTGTDGALELTALGLRAVREETRYTPKEDRLKLYFDGVRCSPLPERFYRRGVRVLDHDSARAQHEFTLFQPATGFSNDAVTALAVRRDRADYNLPDEHENLRVVDNEIAYLPCYVIPAVTTDVRGYRLLPFTAADATASDPYLEDLFRSWTDLNETMITERNSEVRMRDELGKWLIDRNLSVNNLSQVGAESFLRLTLPRNHYPAGDVPAKAKGTYALHRVGSYLTQHGFVLQLWCNDMKTRRNAALERALLYDGEGRRADEDLTVFLGQISDRLKLDTFLTIADLAAYSRRTGRGTRGL
jgi:hypothetical protein